jgi:hypothetical protein
MGNQSLANTVGLYLHNLFVGDDITWPSEQLRFSLRHLVIWTMTLSVPGALSSGARFVLCLLVLTSEAVFLCLVLLSLAIVL